MWVDLDNTVNPVFYWSGSSLNDVGKPVYLYGRSRVNVFIKSVLEWGGSSFLPVEFCSLSGGSYFWIVFCPIDIRPSLIPPCHPPRAPTPTTQARISQYQMIIYINQSESVNIK
jgi:hypothetical protein